ncbi:hypothetical protein NVV93_09235 [Pseudomonas sp. LS44]|uniref:Y-family DNA polymerase n=1 Tax=Pseudomonas sp. LS44 TaxID=1357074 RepID=UPI00215A3D66|nr:hypothetical protein [Pseudomonas sp. LS44]UVE19531.1 hypothetical protein NVV93_09235 [Pseudomonas sp. LS44]
MDDPAFQVRDQFWRSNVQLCSANFPLYGDMSSRMMRTIATLVPKIIPYSIDEAFADCAGMTDKQVFDIGAELRSRVPKWTGIPIGVGIGPTLTLAKVANYAAKRIYKTEPVRP